MYRSVDPPTKTASMRFHCNDGESQRIYLVDDTIFDTYESHKDRQYKHRVFRINFETNSAEFIAQWKDGLKDGPEYECIKGSFLYVSLDPNSIDTYDDAHFLAIYLDKEINSENWTQYVRTYKKVGKSGTFYHCHKHSNYFVVYANRWTEVIYETEGDKYTHHAETLPKLNVFCSDLNYKSKIDHIRNSVCISRFILILEQYFCLGQCSRYLSIRCINGLYLTKLFKRKTVLILHCHNSATYYIWPISAFSV